MAFNYWPQTTAGGVTSVTASLPVTATAGSTPNIAVNTFSGDAGSGGLKGAVPAPVAGDAAAGKFLKASGSWATPPAGSVTAVTGTPPVNSSGGATPAISIDVFTGDSGAGGLAGAVPAPVAGDATKFLQGSGGWATPGSSAITNFLSGFTGASGNPFASPLYAGMKVLIGFTNLTIKGLGRVKVAGNSQSHNLKIVDSLGVDVAGASCSVNMASGVAGDIIQGTFASPVTLTRNTIYFILSQEFAAGDLMLDDTGLITPYTPIANVITSAWINSNGPALPNLNTALKSYVGIDIRV